MVKLGVSCNMINCSLNSINKIESKEQLYQYSKEQLIDMYWSTIKNNRDVMEYIINCSDKDLLDFQREWKWLKQYIDNNYQLCEEMCCLSDFKNKYKFDENGNIIGYEVKL